MNFLRLKKLTNNILYKIKDIIVYLTDNTKS